MVTITEVARKAGVSPTTASYALNGRSCVKEETRLRILEAAKELHYVPNRLAQSFRNGRTNTITVITNEAIESANTFTSEFFGVLAEARARQYDVMVKLVDDTRMSRDQIQSVFRNRVSDGFLLLGNLPEQYLESLDECGVCGVLLSAHTRVPVAQVNCNGRKGIYDMTVQVLEKGRTLPVYLAYSNVTIEEELRRQGFLEALAQAGIDGSGRTFVCGTGQKEIADCIDSCLAQGADCFVCWNDVLAYTVLDILEQRNIPVPEQAAVTGFDDILPTAREKILTTVHQPFFEKGRLAMQLLLAQINGEPCEKKEHFIDCEIISGKSL